MAQVKTIQCLQAGRGLAALAVVLHHAERAGNAFSSDHIYSPPLRYGYLGVDFFFVLSGFIIYHSTVGRGRSAADYAWARFRRVYLPYLPIGIGIALLYTLLPGVSDSDRAWSWLPTVTLLPVSAEPALSVAWTLKHEILFYGLFGLFFFSDRLMLGLALWGIAIVAAAFAGVQGIVPLALINIEFFMGIAIAILYRSGHGHWALMLLAPFPLALWFYLGSPFDYTALVGLALALVILPVARLEADGKLKVPALLTFLGAASYSLYLAHNPTISVAARLIHGQPYWLVTSFTTAAGISGGLAYYLLIEKSVLRVAPGDRRHQRLTGEEPVPKAITEVVGEKPRSSKFRRRGPTA